MHDNTVDNKSSLIIKLQTSVQETFQREIIGMWSS